MILALGGKPDADVAENKRYLKEIEETSVEIKNDLQLAKVKLSERNETISLVGYQSKDRVVLDEEIKSLFEQCEQQLQFLRDVFKRYSKKNQRKMTQQEIEARSKCIDILRKNLNLLKDEFSAQQERHQKKEQSKAKTSSEKKKQNKEFVDIFSLNSSSAGFAPTGENVDEERGLNQAERDLLREFEENDKELEDIAGAIV